MVKFRAYGKKKWERSRVGLYCALVVLLIHCSFPVLGQSSLDLPPALEETVGCVQLCWDILDDAGDQVWSAWTNYRSLSFFSGIVPSQDILINPPGYPSGGFVRITPPEADFPIYSRRPSPESRIWAGSFYYSVGDKRVRAVRFPVPTRDYSQASYESAVQRFLGQDPDGRFQRLFYHQGFITSVILHEAFHVWQSEQNAGKIRGANHETPLLPHSDRDRLLREEGETLTLLFTTTDSIASYRLASDFLRIRKERYRTLTEEDIHFERRNEYVEGLATYIETKSLFVYFDEVDPSLSSLMEEFRVAQIRAVAQDNRSETEAQVRCYFFGMALGFALDHLYGDHWKVEILKDGVYLDVLLEEVVKKKRGSAGLTY